MAIEAPCSRAAAKLGLFAPALSKPFIYGLPFGNALI